MRVQLLSDLHLETEVYEPRAAADAELLILAGDIDSTWRGYERFRGWPVPVVVVAGNHEFDGRDLDAAWPRFREHLTDIGLDLLECDERTLAGRDGRHIRLLGTVRWCDFDLLGVDHRESAMRAGEYFQRVMRARRGDVSYGPEALREDGITCRDWLAAALRRARADVAATLVVTHFAPSRLSVDSRYGAQPTSASFCNDDDDLLAWADVWLHGHVHCQHDYRAGRARVRCNSRGHARRGEAANHDPLLVIDV